MSRFVLALLASCFAASTQAATTTLYDQDFENPANYVNDNRDINISTTVNGNYGNQPAGFAFAQTFTVETLNISGSQRGSNRGAFANGYIDPTGQGGDFAVGLQNRDQNDLLGLSFDVGAFDFFNVQIDISSIDLSTFGAPFVTAPNDLPVFQFTLFDNPSAANTTGGGTILDQTTLTGTRSARDTFDWTTGLFGLSTAGNSNGNVTLQIDLLTGGYAAFDNLTITAADTPPPPPAVPLPATGLLLLAALGALGLRKPSSRHM